MSNKFLEELLAAVVNNDGEALQAIFDRTCGPVIIPLSDFDSYKLGMLNYYPDDMGPSPSAMVH